MICENINIIQNAWGEDAVKHWTAGSLLKENPEWETESVRCRSPLRCGHNDSGRTFSNKPNTLTKKNTPVMELLRPFKCFLNEDESVGAGEACEWLLALWQKPPAQSSHLQEKKDGGLWKELKIKPFHHVLEIQAAGSENILMDFKLFSFNNYFQVCKLFVSPLLIQFLQHLCRTRERKQTVFMGF